MHMKRYLLIAASALALAACGQQATTETAETAATEQPPAMQQAAMSAADFVQTVAASDAFEIQSSELAAQRAARQDVKDLAAMMVTAHRQTTQELTQLTTANSMPAPTPQLNATQQTSLDNLRNQTGEAFDDAYLDAQVAAHQNAVRTFEQYASAGEAGPLRDWAQSTLPNLRQHLASAQGLENAT
jgi:putative membrane protein